MKYTIKAIAVLFFISVLMLLTLWSCGDKEAESDSDIPADTAIVSDENSSEDGQTIEDIEDIENAVNGEIALEEVEIPEPEITNEFLYSQIQEGLLEKAQLFEYVEIQEEIVADVNKLMDEYRNGVYPDMSKTSSSRIAPFPEGCSIPPNIKWDDLQVITWSSEREVVDGYYYAFAIELDNYYGILIEGLFTGNTPGLGDEYKVYLGDVHFYYGNVDDFSNLTRYFPYNTFCIHLKEFKEFLDKTAEEYNPGIDYEFFYNLPGQGINCTYTEISVPLKFKDGLLKIFKFNIIRENGKESYSLIE